MERRAFIKRSAVAAGTAVIAGSVNAAAIPASEKDFYELKVYQLTGGAGKSQLLKYYSEALIPFLNSHDAKVGIFNEFGMEDPPRMYILHAHKSPETYLQSAFEMKNDKKFQDAARAYFSLPASQPVYERYETFLMSAFDSIPQIKTPDANRGLFELRTYESYNEDAGHRKVKMFNDEELPLFEKVGLHPVFFGQLMAGSLMPALTYMLWFEDMEQRNANWQKFVTSDEWNVMKNKEIYADTVSKVRKKFLTPDTLSQI